jgi:hypothetical protein
VGAGLSGVQFPTETRDFLSSETAHIVTSQPPIEWVPVFLSSGKTAGAWSWPLTPTYWWVMIELGYIFARCLHGVDRDNFAVYSLKVIFLRLLQFVLSAHTKWILYSQSKDLIIISYSDMKYSYCIVLLFYYAFQYIRLIHCGSLPLLVQTAVMVYDVTRNFSACYRPCWYDGNCVRLLVVQYTLDDCYRS